MQPQSNTAVEQAIMSATGLKTRFPGLKVEVCGTWVWVSGNTYPVREKLSESGLKFNRKKQEWFLPPDGNKKKTGRGHKSMSREHITFKYGRLEVEEQEQTA